MGWRTLLLLLLVVGGLAAVLHFTDAKPKVEEVAERSVLDGRRLEDSRRVRWQLQGRPQVVVGRQDGGAFRLVEPLDDEVAKGRLRQLFDIWNAVQMRRTPLRDGVEDDRKQAGLVPPELVFDVEWPDGTTIHVDVGGPGPLGTTRFVRRDGVIYEGGQGLVESVQVGLEDLREHQVFHNEAPTTSELRVDLRTASGKLEPLHLKLEKGEWLMLSPSRMRADPAVAMRFLTTVLSLRVDSFVPGTVRFPDREPEVAIVARGAAGEEEVRLWLEGGQLYGQMPNRKVVFLSGNVQYSQIFGNAVDELRARILLPVQGAYEKVLDLAIDPGQGRGERIRLRRESATSEWRIAEPIEFPADATACVEAIQAISNLFAIEFVGAGAAQPPDPNDPRYGLGAERLTVAVIGPDQKPQWTLWVGAPTTAGDQPARFVCRADEPANIVVAGRQQLEALFRPWTDYCQRDVLTKVPVVGRVELQPRDGAAIVYRNDGGHWTRGGDATPRDEVGGFVNDVLRDLRGDRAVDLRKAAFGDADWTVKLCRETGDELTHLRVWVRGGELPLIVQAGATTAVGFEVSPFVGKQLRSLWE